MFNKKELIEKKETLLEKLQNSKDQHGIIYVNVCNDGSIKKDKLYETTMLKYANEKDAFKSISEFIYDANESYAREIDYDTLNTNILLGLIFSSNDMDENCKLKDNAEPIEGVVRYITDSTACYLDGEKIKTIDWGKLRLHKGYINYDILVNSIANNGLTFNGPKTFKEFKEKILVGEPFEISISANFNTNNKQEEKTQYVKEK